MSRKPIAARPTGKPIDIGEDCRRIMKRYPKTMEYLRQSELGE